MKFSIHGFYQPRAVELGLTNDDLLVLRWFVDFAGTEKMKTIIEQDGIYYWINYSTILEDLPVLNITKKTLKRKHFDKLCDAEILKHKHIKQGGSFSYYAYGINYQTLVYLQDNTPSTNLGNPSSELSKGCDENEQTPSTNLGNPCIKIGQTKINLLNNSFIKNKSTKYKLVKKNKYINNKYFENDELDKIFIDFLEVRKKLKAVNSERAINSLIKTLSQYDDDTKYKMIENSITNSWKGIFPLKENKPYKQQQPVRQEILPDWFNKNTSSTEATAAEQKEMEDLLREFDNP